MAENSGVTAADIQEKLKSSLDATHVEIEDMSGTCFRPLHPVRLEYELT